MKRRRKRAAGSRRRRLDRRAGCASARTRRLSVKQRRLALSRSSASVGEWGWCCFAAPGRKNAWERKKVRTHQGTAWGGGEYAHWCASVRVPLSLGFFFSSKFLLNPSQLRQFLCLCWTKEVIVFFYSYIYIYIYIYIYLAITFAWQRSSSSSDGSRPMCQIFAVHNKRILNMKSCDILTIFFLYF